MTCDADASRDLTQNVFMKIIRYSQSWKEDRVFVHWFFRIARNIMVDYFRGARKYNLPPEIETNELTQLAVNPNGILFTLLIFQPVFRLFFLIFLHIFHIINQRRFFYGLPVELFIQRS